MCVQVWDDTLLADEPLAGGIPLGHRAALLGGRLGGHRTIGKQAE